MQPKFEMNQRVTVLNDFYGYKTEGIVVEVARTICKVAFPHRIDAGTKDVRSFSLKTGKELNQGGIAAHLYMIKVLS